VIGPCSDQVAVTTAMQHEPSKPSRWVKGMPSPNKAGRPPGIIDRRQKLQNAFADDAVAIAKVCIDKALAGDMTAANICLARISPPLKQQAERVQFELDPDRPLAAQANQILVAVSEGNLDAETGRTLIACIQSVSGIKAAEELEQRIITLEMRGI
jgi:hypothetical protein